MNIQHISRTACLAALALAALSFTAMAAGA